MEAEMNNILVKPQSTYINPYTDFGFKKLFGEEGSKDLLIDFLNQLLPPEYNIVGLEFRDKEMSPEIPEFRRAIFDLYCENERKDKFDWNFKLKPVYFIGILDFEFDEGDKDGEYVMEVEYKDQNNKVFYDKLKYFFVVMPRFNKSEKDLKTHKDKWIYFLKNLSSFEDIPAILNEPIFQKGFELAKIANYDAKQLTLYEQSYNDYLSFKASMDFQFNQGVEKGVEIGMEKGMEKVMFETAKNAVLEGLPNGIIGKITNLTNEQIENIRKELKYTEI
ncbi:MAG: PD-(D/E)XK nuclease family transposase [Mariniphaga sp.]